MKTYSVRYRIGPQVAETRDLLVTAPAARGAVHKAREVLNLRYPHHIITAIFPAISFDSDPQELYPHAGARR